MAVASRGVTVSCTRGSIVVRSTGGTVGSAPTNVASTIALCVARAVSRTGGARDTLFVANFGGIVIRGTVGTVGQAPPGVANTRSVVLSRAIAVACDGIAVLTTHASISRHTKACCGLTESLEAAAAGWITRTHLTDRRAVQIHLTPPVPDVLVVVGTVHRNEEPICDNPHGAKVVEQSDPLDRGSGSGILAKSERVEAAYRVPIVLREPELKVLDTIL